MDELLRILSVSGDLGVWVAVAILWRLDTRLSKCEWNIQRLLKAVFDEG